MSISADMSAAARQAAAREVAARASELQVSPLDRLEMLSEIGVMGALPAVGVIHRRALAAAEDPEQERARLAAEYAETMLRPEVAARDGHVDELIAPRDTRARVSWALRSPDRH